MSESQYGRCDLILKIGRVQHRQLSRLHEFLDKCQTDRLAGKDHYSIPRLLSAKCQHEFEGYLIEVEIPLGDSRDRPRSFVNEMFDALSIFPSE